MWYRVLEGEGGEDNRRNGGDEWCGLGRRRALLAGLVALCSFLRLPVLLVLFPSLILAALLTLRFFPSPYHTSGGRLALLAMPTLSEIPILSELYINPQNLVCRKLTGEESFVVRGSTAFTGSGWLMISWDWSGLLWIRIHRALLTSHDF